MLGATLGHYQILETLGEGGMGIVYKARDLKLERLVAIKVLPRDKTGDPARKHRFLQEARAASALNHPNIVVIHEVAEADGVDFIVMEYVPGRTLDQVIPRTGLRAPETLRYAAQIASALTVAHEAGITHRDLKPGNLMVTDKGVVKVLDFGLAKFAEAPIQPDDATRAARPVTEKGSILGTIAYMSPEQAEGKPVDPRSDIFSFGSVLYEMCTGSRAFAAESKLSTLSLILREDPKPVRALNQETPPELERIINRCLRKNPARRFQSTADLQIALEELREESDSGRLSGSMAAPAKPAATPWGRWVALAAGLAVLGAAGMWVYGRKPTVQSQQGPVLSQLTFDTGLTTEPSYWAQGNLIAYASDRATDGQNLDIWIQQLNGGEARRLTTNAADDRTPDIAPDGSKIVFRSERDGGGLYVVPTIGGAERKIAPNGYDPKFSPDGQWIAYWTGDSSTTPTVFISNNSDARIMLVPANGGSPKQAFPGTGAFRPTWSPDSKHLLFGWWNARGSDWYVVPIAGGEPVRTELRKMAAAAKLEVIGHPMRWASNGIYFNARVGDGTNTWKASIDPRTFQCLPEIARVTSSSGTESHITVTGDTMVYASTLNNDDVYILPIDTDQAKITGEPVRLTRNTAPEYGASISHDGKRVGYAALMSGNFVVTVRDLESGADTRLASIPGTGTAAMTISPDGKRMAWGLFNNGMNEIHLGSLDGASVKLASVGAVRAWGGDPGRLLLTRATKDEFGGFLVDPDSGKETKVMRLPAGMATSGIHLSMDGHAGVFYSSQAGVTKVYLMPLFADRLTTEKDLIEVTDGTHLDILPEISPNGKTVYFYSNRDGNQCLWAQRLNPETRRPEGAAFVVKHFHSARISPAYVGGGRRRIDTAHDKIVFTMAERTGNIWRADLPQ